MTIQKMKRKQPEVTPEISQLQLYLQLLEVRLGVALEKLEKRLDKLAERMDGLVAKREMTSCSYIS